MSLAGLLRGFLPLGAPTLWEASRHPVPHPQGMLLELQKGSLKLKIPAPLAGGGGWGREPRTETFYFCQIRGQICSLLTRKAKEKAVGQNRGIFLILLLFIQLK